MPSFNDNFKSELYKFNSKTSSLEINVVYINEHNLDAYKKIKEVKENSNIININKSNKDLGSQLIKGSLNKPLEWHITNIQNNNINLAKNQIKFLLYKYRNESYPNDIEFNFMAIDTKITLDENDINSKDLPFCMRIIIYWKKKKIINTKNKDF